jgi:TPR repeat protein
MKARLLVALLCTLLSQRGWADVADALGRVAILEDSADFAAILEVLAPYRDTGDPDVEFYVAFASFNLTMDAALHDPTAIPDTSESIRWAEQAADHGSAAALNLLSIIYENGLGVDADAGKARTLLEQAADAGDPGAVLNLTTRLFMESGDDDPRMCRGIEQMLGGDGINVVAIYYSGLIAYSGMCGQPADEEGGFELIRAAAEDGYADAAVDMGRYYEYGLAAAPDYAAAFAWYERAADLDHPEGMWRAGIAYATGDGVDRDPGRAVVYFRDAADAGNLDGMVSLAVMYATGDGVGQDFVRARELYEEAAAYGSATALKNLAVMYALGQGIDVDLVESRVLLEMAIEFGEPDAVGIREWVLSEMDDDELASADLRIAAWLDEHNGQ